MSEVTPSLSPVFSSPGKGPLGRGEGDHRGLGTVFIACSPGAWGTGWLNKLESARGEGGGLNFSSLWVHVPETMLGHAGAPSYTHPHRQLRRHGAPQSAPAHRRGRGRRCEFG